VRYEYSERQSEILRSVPTELYTLALELWRADSDLEMFSFNKELYHIVGIDEFPTNSAEDKEFFARACVQINEQLYHTFGFYLRTKHPLSVLSQCNGKVLQNFLIGRKTWLRRH
jgi:hypothetical protein